MKRLIIHGDPGVRKDATIEYEDEAYVCFAVNRQGDWHGPERPQLWCTIGTEDERETFDRQDYIPMHLETVSADAEAVNVVESA